MTFATPQSIIGSLGWWTISFLPPFEGNNDTFIHSIRICMKNVSLSKFILSSMHLIQEKIYDLYHQGRKNNFSDIKT